MKTNFKKILSVMLAALFLLISNVLFSAVNADEPQSDLESAWRLSETIERVDFDNSPNISGSRIQNLIDPVNLTCSLDGDIKQGGSGYSLKSTSLGNAALTFNGHRVFKAVPEAVEYYAVSYDFCFSAIPAVDTASNTIFFEDDSGSRGTVGGLQIERGSGNVLINSANTGYSLSAGEWHNYTIVLKKDTAEWEEYYDGHLVNENYFTSQTGPLHIYTVELYFPKEDGLSVYVDNAVIASVKDAALSVKNASAKGYTAEIEMNSAISTVNVDFMPLITLWKDDKQIKINDIKYVSGDKKFVITTSEPIISSSEYTVALDSSIMSTDGIKIKDGYNKTFISDANSLDISNLTIEGAMIRADLVNTTGEEKTAVMAALGKADNGIITSFSSSELKRISGDSAIIRMDTKDYSADGFEVFFIDDWASRIPLRRVIIEDDIVPDPAPSVSALYDFENNELKISGNSGNTNAIDALISVASEDMALSEGTVIENPFSESTPPVLAALCSMDENGIFTKTLVLPEDFESGIYYVYADSEAGSAFTKVVIFNPESDATKEILEKCNGISSISSLAAYLNDNIEDLGFDPDAAASYAEKIAGRVIANRPKSGYSLAELNSVVGYAVAAEKIREGTAPDSVMKAYSYVFGCTYSDYTSLSESDRTAFNKLIAEIAAEDKIYDFDELSLIAKVRAASKTWGTLRDCMTENADALGVDMGASSKYMSIPSGYRYEVFGNLTKKMSDVTTLQEIVTEFNKAVTDVYNEHKNEGGSSGKTSSKGTSGKSSSGGSSFGNTTVPIDNPNTSAVSPTAKITFYDIDNHFSQEAVEYLAIKRIISGYPDGSFRPDASVTRAEFSAMISRAFDVVSGEGTQFDDVSAGDWFFDYVTALSSHGIILGDGRAFYPEDEILRQDAAVIIARVLQYAGKTYEGTADFEDIDEISAYAEDAVGAMAGAGVIVGSDNRFYPLSRITRGEAAVMIYRAFKIRMGA